MIQERDELGLGLQFELEIEDEDSVSELFRMWRNERASPELQENPEDLIREVLELIEFQSMKLSKHQESLSEAAKGNFAFLDCLYQMDLERVKFVLKSFLRCRLGKIEKGWAEFWPNWSSQARSDYLQSKLTSFEREYLQSFASNLVSSLQESVLDRIPDKMASLDDEEMQWNGARPVASNQPDSHVICKVKRDLGDVVLDPITRATAPLQSNDIFVLQYSVIKQFLDTGDVELI